MTAPDQSSPVGSIGVGGFAAWQAQTVGSAKSQMTTGVLSSYTGAQDVHRTEVRDRIDGAYTQIEAVEGDAASAVLQAEAAANAAAAAEATAASASERASYWETEFVVASAGLVLGVNEILLGPVQNVPGGLTRTLTDMHIGFISQPGGLTFELKKWDSLGTTDTVLGTYTIGANVTRANWGSLNFGMTTRERVFINFTSITGSIAPVVAQVLIFGVME
ncbi:hypothetical protein [Nocardia wallacei]|uniref:hypothetical protein n=1 Tax=Nocardia wallacei TaxID=480035 RepID=UPI0024552840|nr:hypothetical protein [Nocardia wallacei]